MSCKYNLLDTDRSVKVTKRPQCSAETARRYRAKHSHLRTAQNSRIDREAIATEDRRAEAFALVRHRFGRRCADHPDALGCEALLRDALYRWILAAARTSDSRATYAARLWRFCRDTDRRSLSAHTDAGQDAILDWLMALEAAGLSRRSVVGHRDALRSWFAWLVDREIIDRTPIRRHVLRAFPVDHQAVEKGSGTRVALTLDEAQRIATWATTTAPPAVALAVMLQLSAGLRSAEVAGLQQRHLTIRPGLPALLSVPGKGRKLRQIELELVVMAAWERYAASGGKNWSYAQLITGQKPGPLSPKTIQRWAKLAARQVGRDGIITSHDLRRTSATLLHEAGAAIEQIQAHHGHANPATTLRSYVVRHRRMDVTTGITAKTGA
jgi:integrase/recombinase XerC